MALLKPKTPRKKLTARQLAAYRRRQAAIKRRRLLLAKQAAARKKAAAAAAAAQAKAAALPAAPVSSATPPPVAVAPQPLPAPAPATIGPAPASTGTPGPTPSAATGGPMGRADAERLLWRAGFGPRPGDIERFAAMGLDAAVDTLVRPVGDARLVGPEPHDGDGNPLAPEDLWGHDACWWFDRMVRSDQPLVERMTLIWHDWFACSREKVGSARLMLDQNALFRRNALGSFADLLRDVTTDPAMLLFLDGVDNSARSPNENYAREIMELFTLGAGRGAYTEDDVRQLARAFTGWKADWADGVGFTNFRYVPTRHDNGTKTVFGRAGNWGVADGWRLCLEHPMHASFFVTKLWSAFIPTPPSADTLASLAHTYVSGAYQIAPVVAAILKHPDLYRGPRMVKAPVVFAAGLVRGTGMSVTSDAWSWLLPGAGQQLFYPPNVSGWDETRWLDTNTFRGRWSVVAYLLAQIQVDPWSRTSPYSTTESPAEAVDAALSVLARPSLTAEVRAALEQTAASMIAPTLKAWELGPQRGRRQNALRLLIATCSDHQTS